MSKALSLVVALALSATPLLPQDSPAGSDPELEAGIRQVNDGELQTGVFTLDAVIRKLTPEGAARARELAQAHLYQGIAYVGLAQEQRAKASFAQALNYDPTLRLAAEKYPARVVRVFEAARQGKSKSVLLPPSTAPKKAGIGALGIAGIVAGVLAIGGGAAAVARGGDSNKAPMGSFSVSPAPPALMGATVVTFSATGSDPEGDALTYAWNFGDGLTDSGQSVTHVFKSAGSLSVILTIQDAKGAQATVTNPVTVKTISGRWVDADTPRLVDFVQTGSTFTGSVFQPVILVYHITSGIVSDPRNVTFHEELLNGQTIGVFTGSLDTSLDHIETVRIEGPGRIILTRQ